jgi:hypothetical protein
VVGADGQHVAQAQAADAVSQITAAVDLVAGDHRRVDPQLAGVLDEVPGELRLGLEQHFLGDPGQFAVLLIGRADPGQVQGPTEQRVAPASGVGQGDRDLAQVDPAGAAGVLPCRPDRVG